MSDMVRCPRCGGPALECLDWRGDPYIRCDAIEPCVVDYHGDAREIEARCRAIAENPTLDVIARIVRVLDPQGGPSEITFYEELPPR